MSKQAQVVDWALNLAQQGQEFLWTHNPNFSSLSAWAAANLDNNTPGPLPPLNGNLVMICYEFPLYAAATVGAITLKQLVGLYKQVYVNHKSWDTVLNGYWFSDPTTYDPKTHQPDIPKGNIVFFNDAEHIAMSTGDRGQYGNQMIVSFWGFSPNPNNGVPTPLTVDSVEALVEIMKPSNVKVGFAKAPW